MREALGNTMIFNIVIVIVIIIIGLLVGSLSYSKAFKVKNMLINIIEENNGYNDTAKNEIEQNLREMGYRLNKNGQQTCRNDNPNAVALNVSSNYRYCIFKISENRGVYYAVSAYMYFDFPFIGSKLEFAIDGDTKIKYFDEHD